MKLSDFEKQIQDAENLLPVFQNRVPQSIRLSEIPIEEEIEYIVQDYVPANSLTLLSGMPETGKTSIVASWIASITNDTQWLGKEVISGNVLYVLLEDNPSKLARIMRDNGADMDKIHVLMQVTRNKPVVAFHENETFTLPEHTNILQDEILAIKPVLIVVDALGRAVGKNAKRIQEEIAECLRSICVNTGIGMILINHLEKGRYHEKNIETRIANNPAFHALARISYLIAKDDSTQNRALLTIKNNLSEHMPPFIYRIRKNGENRVKLEPINNSAFRMTLDEITRIEYESMIKNKILACLSVYGECTPIYIGITIEENYSTVKVYLGQLLRDGSIEKKRGHKYALPSNVVVSMDVETLSALQEKKAACEKEKSYTQLCTSDSKVTSSKQDTSQELQELYEKQILLAQSSDTDPSGNGSTKDTVRTEESPKKAIEEDSLDTQK